MDETIGEYGHVDAVVSNMGHGGSVPEAIKTVGFDPDFDGPLLELSDELWHESLDMYVLNVVRLTRIVTPIMIDQGGGAFVNISSMNTIEPRAPYPMSKEIGQACVFLASDAATYINGQCILSDGGMNRAVR